MSRWSATRHTLGLVPEAATPVPYRCPLCNLAQDNGDDPTKDPEVVMADQILRCPAHPLNTQFHDFVRTTLVQLIK